MLSREKKKMCWNCGGEVPESSIRCDFCGGDFSSQKEEEKVISNPYSQSYEADEIPNAPYHAPHSYEMSNHEESPSINEVEKGEKERKSVISLSFLLPGITLLLLGLGIFFFSEDGYFTLKWDASYGVFILLTSLVFIYLGIRNFNKL